MQSAARFGAYAAAFEKTYEDDDWSRLEAFFTPDACYVVTGEPPLGGRWDGREKAIAHLHDIVNELDRRFDKRRTELVGQPEITDSTFRMQWKAIYEKAGCPDLVIGGIETATFENELISELIDDMEEGSGLNVQRYMAKYFDSPVSGKA